MKQPISWHKECLSNWHRTNSERKEQIARMQAEYDRSQRELIAYDAQIIRAEELGLDGFDRDKFGKKRNGHTS